MTQQPGYYPSPQQPQQPYGYAPQPGYPPPAAPPQPYGQPAPQYAPQPQHGMAAPPPPMPAGPGMVSNEQLDQSAPVQQPRLTDLQGRLVFVLPRKLTSSTEYGDRIDGDVIFFDGAPITHVTRDDGMKQLATPCQPQTLIEECWITGGRIVSALKPYVGRGQGFVRRVGKDGRAWVLKDATPAEVAQVQAALPAIYARGAQDPFVAAQAAAQAPAAPQQPSPQQYPGGQPVPQYAPQPYVQQAPPSQPFDPNAWAQQQGAPQQQPPTDPWAAGPDGVPPF